MSDTERQTMLTPREGVTDHHIDTAMDYLKALSPSYGRFAGKPSTWIYRGQANADWKIRARGLREPNVFKTYGFEGDASDSGIRSQLQQTLLERFHEGLDRLGIVIPKASSDEHHILPVMALAQHHGLPTTLLDWTRRAVVAAYFAAVEAADPEKRDPKSSHLAVWGLQCAPEWFRRTDAVELSLYQPAAATNPNLRAQSGVLMLRSRLGDEFPDLEEHMRRLKTAIGGTFLLHRLTLPVFEASKLLRLLSYEGIDGAAMFPGADGVVRAMREVAMWDKPGTSGL